MEKEMEQEMEWLEAQKIEISVDIFAAAKQQLQFLGVVDQNQWFYDGPILERAIYRYNAYWLPLLAKYSESSMICEGPLVPPFDCEWVWHCHRLNPVRYKSDCEQFYGRLLDNSGVVSSANGNCKLQTENLWKRLYPLEPYDLDLDKAISEPKDTSVLEKFTTYDLASAIKRQSSFYYTVLKSHVDNDIIMQEAVGRYKAFLYLIKKNHEKSTKLISVPTCDIDLIWHTHQLNPSSYHKDLEKIFGYILHHDDTDSDITEGSKLDTVFSGTTSQWEETFGQMYWKASAETTPVGVVADKNSARCRAVAAEQNSARCCAVVAEQISGRCCAVAAEKNSGKCCAVAAEKNSGRCCAVAAEKNIAQCLAMAAEKNIARCRAIAAEKNSGRCCAVAAEKNRAQCLAMAAEKNSGRCCAVAAEKNSAQCLAMAAEKNIARCRAIAAEKNSGRCCAVEAEKNSAQCLAMAAEKNIARCCAIAAEKNIARCCAIAAEKNSEFCNMMKNNANDNAPLAEALNGVVAA